MTNAPGAPGPGVPGNEGSGDPAPQFVIRGRQVGLGPLRRDLLPQYQRWINDFQTVRTLAMAPKPLTLEQEQAWYDSAATSERDVGFTIYELAGSRPIGNTGLHGIDHHHRNAEFGILIGEADARGRGYGTETTSLMADYAFTALGLHNLMLRVFEFNLAGRRAYTKAGFREFGRRRQCRLMGGRLWDEILMECLSTEFTSPVLAAIFVPDEPRDVGSMD